MESQNGSISMVPQCSVPSPTVFVIFINDLSDIVYSRVNIFADDTTYIPIIKRY